MSHTPALRFLPKTVLALESVYRSCFEYTTGGDFQQHVRIDWFSDFLFAKGYDPFIVEAAKHLPVQRGAIAAFVRGLYNGTAAVPFADEDARSALVRRLVEDVLEYSGRKKILVKPGVRYVTELLEALGENGLEVRDGRVVPREEDVVPVREEASELERLFTGQELEKPEQFAHSLKTSDQHYSNELFGDCIKQARDAFEVALLGVARAAAKIRGKNLARSALPGPVRAFLRDNAIVSDEEEKLLFALHTILSIHGGHANMSERDHARICRQYALTTIQFILLRWGSLRGEYR